MATLTVHDVDDDLVQRLKDRAERSGHSAEEEVRAILRATLSAPQPKEDDWIGSPEYVRRMAAMERLAEFRQRTAGRGSQSVVELLREYRAMQMRPWMGDDEDV